MTLFPFKRRCKCDIIDIESRFFSVFLQFGQLNFVAGGTLTLKPVLPYRLPVLTGIVRCSSAAAAPDPFAMSRMAPTDRPIICPLNKSFFII